jgi:methyl coenzyme M reductase gamma subunit
MNPRIHEKYYPGDKLVARNRPDWKPVCKELHKIREDNGSENVVKEDVRTSIKVSMPFKNPESGPS